MAAPGAPKKHSRSQVQIPGHNHASADDQQIYLISDLDTASDITPDDQVFQEETFEILAALDIDPQWITVDEAMKVQSGNPHFFVTPVFSGKVFDHLESCKCKVLGTSLIRKCLQDGRPIPKKSHPIFSSTLRKTKICFTGISRERRGHLSKLVRYMDGVAEGNLYPTVTHLVTEKGSYSSNKYRAAKTTRIPIMKPVWIEDAWKEAKKLSDRDFTGVDIVEKYLLPVFNSMVICTSGVSGQERQDLVRLIEMNGGKSPGEMKKGLCTHLVTDKTTGDKYLKAKQWANVIIVTVRWVRKCVELGYVQDEKKYDPAKPTEPVAKNSTQKPGAEPPRDLDTSSIYGPLKQTVISFEEHNTTGKTVHSPVTPFTMPRTQSRRLLPSEDEVNEIIRSLDKVFDTTLNGDFDFFESCCIFVAGVDKARQEKINRVLDRCGATRVNSIERATHIVVTVVKDSEKRVLIEAQSRGVAVLRSDWLFGCIDGKQFLPTDEYLWDQDPARPGILSSSVVAASRLSIDSVRTRVSGFVETPRAGTHIQAAHQMDIDFTEPLEFHACATSTPKIPHGQPRGSKSTERFNPRFHIEGVSQLVAEMPSPVITEEEDSMACITVTQMGKRLAEAAMKTGQAPRVEPFRAISDQTLTVRSTRITEKELYKTTPRREKKGTVVAAKPDPSEEAARSDQLMQKQMNFLAQTARSTSEEPMQPMSSTKRKRPHEMIADSPASDTVKRVSALEPAVDWHTTITHVHQDEELVVVRTGGAIHTSVQEVRDESLNISMDVPVNAADLATKSIVITDHFSKQGDVAPVSTRQSSERRTKENVTPLKLRPTSVKPTRTPPMRAAKQIQRPHVFMFTGLTAEEKQMCEEAIVKLGGRLATEQNDIPNELTHLICGKLVRGSKLMGCVASGRWIITTAYLRDSMTVGKFLPEERFEWGNPVNMAKYKLQGREVQLAKASLRWRLTLRENNKKGVFSGWRVILYASREKEKGLVPLLKAGDADVTTREKMTCSIAEYEPTHVIPVKSDSWTQEELKQVVEAGAKVFPLEYISNLLIEEFVREEDCYHRDYQVFLDCMP